MPTLESPLLPLLLSLLQVPPPLPRWTSCCCVSPISAVRSMISALRAKTSASSRLGLNARLALDNQYTSVRKLSATHHFHASLAWIGVLDRRTASTFRFPPRRRPSFVRLLHSVICHPSHARLLTPSISSSTSFVLSLLPSLGRPSLPLSPSHTNLASDKTLAFSRIQLYLIFCVQPSAPI